MLNSELPGNNDGKKKDIKKVFPREKFFSRSFKIELRIKGPSCSNAGSLRLYASLKSLLHDKNGIQ